MTIHTPHMNKFLSKILFWPITTPYFEGLSCLLLPRYRSADCGRFFNLKCQCSRAGKSKATAHQMSTHSFENKQDNPAEKANYIIAAVDESFLDCSFPQHFQRDMDHMFNWLISCVLENDGFLKSAFAAQISALKRSSTTTASSLTNERRNKIYSIDGGLFTSMICTRVYMCICVSVCVSHRREGSCVCACVLAAGWLTTGTRTLGCKLIPFF